jgi:hypothetical protein
MEKNVYTNTTKMLDFIESNIVSNSFINIPKTPTEWSSYRLNGGNGEQEPIYENETRPYYSFKKTMDTVFGYFNVIYENKQMNEQKYTNSVNDLDKTCDCSKYKCKKEDLDSESESDNEREHSDSESDNESESDDESKKDASKKMKTTELNEPNTNKEGLLLKKNGIIE